MSRVIKIRSLPWSCRIPDGLFSPKRDPSIVLVKASERTLLGFNSGNNTVSGQRGMPKPNWRQWKQSAEMPTRAKQERTRCQTRPYLDIPFTPIWCYTTLTPCVFCNVIVFFFLLIREEMLLPTFVIVKSVSSDNLCRTWTTLVCCCYLKKCNFLTLIFQVCQEYLPLAGETRERYCRSLDR